MIHAVRGALGTLFADPASFDEGVEAARNACVAGAPISAAFVTAACYYDNPLSGAPAVIACMRGLEHAALSLASWSAALDAQSPLTDDADIRPGFGLIDDAQHAALVRTAGALASQLDGKRLAFFVRERAALEAGFGRLNAAGLCALVFLDLGLSHDAAERTYLELRIAPAIGEAQAARRAGLKNFPFFERAYQYEGPWPSARTAADSAALDLHKLAAEVGLDL